MGQSTYSNMQIVLSDVVSTTPPVKATSTVTPGQSFKGQTYYEILGVTPDADETAIKKAYRKKALASHADKSADHGHAFLLYQQAYEVLSSSSLRQAYDANRHPSHDNEAWQTTLRRKNQADMRETQAAHEEQIRIAEEREAQKQRAENIYRLLGDETGALVVTVASALGDQHSSVAGIGSIYNVLCRGVKFDVATKQFDGEPTGQENGEFTIKLTGANFNHFLPVLSALGCPGRLSNYTRSQTHPMGQTIADTSGITSVKGLAFHPSRGFVPYVELKVTDATKAALFLDPMGYFMAEARRKNFSEQAAVLYAMAKCHEMENCPKGALYKTGSDNFDVSCLLSITSWTHFKTTGGLFHGDDSDFECVVQKFSVQLGALRQVKADIDADEGLTESEKEGTLLKVKETERSILDFMRSGDAASDGTCQSFMSSVAKQANDIKDSLPVRASYTIGSRLAVVALVAISFGLFATTQKCSQMWWNQPRRHTAPSALDQLFDEDMSSTTPVL